MELKADVLLVTVTKVETDAVIKIFENSTGTKARLEKINKRVFHDFGKINSLRVVLIQSQMGAGGASGAQQTVNRAIEAVLPSSVIMLGIAFGVNPRKQRIGDILVSTKLMLYDLERVGKEKISRGARPEASPELINLVQSVEPYWSKKNRTKILLGTMLTGSKLIDDLDFRNELQKQEKEAIGGEMEGAGVYAACYDAKTDWLIVKSIADWANGKKNKNKIKNQEKAATNAAKFVYQALSLKEAKTIPQEPITEVKNNKIFPFTNRQDEVRDVVSLSHVRSYFLVHAPARYGKSRFLEQLLKEFKSRYPKKNMHYALVQAQKTSTIEDIAKSIAKQLHLFPNKTNKSIPWGDRLVNALRISNKAKNISGLILMIDLDGESSPHLLLKLVEEFIPSIHKNLRNGIRNFQTKQAIFRVIIAGRHLASLPEGQYSDVYKRWTDKSIRLSTFNFENVRESANLFLKTDIDVDGSLDQIVAHTLHYTGGHPYCVSEVMYQYKKSGMQPDVFIKRNKKMIWEKFVSKTANDVRNKLSGFGIPLEVIDALSVYRFLDLSVAQKIVNQYREKLVQTNINDFDDLWRKLTQSRFFEAEKGNAQWISDSIARRLMVIRLRQEDHKKYISYCEEAQKNCKDLIPQDEYPARRIVEYLFQTLQLETFHVDTSQQRIKIRKDFMNQVVPNILETFAKSKKIDKSKFEFHRNLIIAEIEDSDRNWEFQFLLNYYLRDKFYSNKPINDLRKKIEKFSLK